MLIRLPDGESRSIAHLAPMRISCPCDPIGRPLAIRVSFANHCYTEKFDPLRHGPSDILFREGPGRDRVFCGARYRLSHRLPELMAGIGTRRVHQTSQARNYVYAARLAADSCEYMIFFMLQRAAPADGADLRLTVESAYANDRPALKMRPREIRFVILARKVLMGQAVRFAPR